MVVVEQDAEIRGAGKIWRYSRNFSVALGLK